jgi:hypothetical protein
LEMAKRSKKPAAAEEQPVVDDSGAMTGYPGHGDAFDPVDEVQQPSADDPVDPPSQPQDLTPQQMIDRAKEEMRREMQALMAQRPPAPQMATPMPQPQPDPEPDWDKLLFDNPKEALRLHGERVARDIEAKMTKRYQQDVGERDFWTEFYRDNPDLKNDDDLVKATMQKNMAELAVLVVPDASKKLAELTRARILGYAQLNGRQPRPATRTRVEGQGSTTERQPAPEPERPATLGDVLKARRTMRTSRAVGA